MATHGTVTAATVLLIHTPPGLGSPTVHPDTPTWVSPVIAAPTLTPSAVLQFGANVVAKVATPTWVATVSVGPAPSRQATCHVQADIFSTRTLVDVTKIASPVIRTRGNTARDRLIRRGTTL